MSFNNGVLTSTNSIGLRGLPGIGFKLDANNDYDMQNKKLVNVEKGTNNDDVVTKSQLDSEIANISIPDTTQFVKKIRGNYDWRSNFTTTAIPNSWKHE